MFRHLVKCSWVRPGEQQRFGEEIGIVGVAAAIANAIYHATAIRIRDLPITPDSSSHRELVKHELSGPMRKDTAP